MLSVNLTLIVHTSWMSCWLARSPPPIPDHSRLFHRRPFQLLNVQPRILLGKSVGCFAELIQFESSLLLHPVMFTWVNKVRYLSSTFDPSHLWRHLISKQSNICEIQKRFGSANERQVTATLPQQQKRHIQETIKTVYYYHANFVTIIFTHVNSTRCSAIAERPRCRERYSFRQK